MTGGSRSGRRRAALALTALVALALAVTVGCAAAGPDAVALPPVGATPDYQLGGAYDPAPEVAVVGRDREAEPAAGRYSICYVNAFQTQPGELDDWPEDLLLQADGAPVRDPDWPDEVLLDTSDADGRDRIAAVVTGWIEGCAADGFDAVEFDNLDSFTRSGGALTLDDNLALATVLARAAHSSGLAAGQKNAAEHARILHERAGFDFAVAEECAAFRECDAYSAVYGSHVIDIEYTDRLPRSFAEMCADRDAPSSMVLRDRELRTPDEAGHRFATCS